MNVNREKGISASRVLAFLSLAWAIMMAAFTAYLLAIFIHDGGVGGVPLEISSSVAGDKLSYKIEITDRKEIVFVTLPFTLGFNVYLLMIAELLKYVAFIVAFILLARFFNSISKERLFSIKNSFYLKFVGYVVFSVGVYHFFRKWIVNQAIQSELTKQGLNYSSTGGYASEFIMLGMVIMVFAYIFEEGRKIYEEQELMI